MIGKIECGVAVERRAVLHIQRLGQQLIETAGSRVTDPVYGFFGSGSLPVPVGFDQAGGLHLL